MTVSVKQAREIGMTDTQICDLIQQQQEDAAGYMRSYRANVSLRKLRKITSGRMKERKKDLPSTDVLSSTSVSGRAKRKPKVPLPDDFNPVIQVTEADELERFKDHARSTARLCADWNAAWRNWLR